LEKVKDVTEILSLRTFKPGIILLAHFPSFKNNRLLYKKRLAHIFTRLFTCVRLALSEFRPTDLSYRTEVRHA